MTPATIKEHHENEGIHLYRARTNRFAECACKLQIYSAAYKLRNALANYKFTLPLTNPKSELSENAKKEVTLTYALHDQFKTDARII